MGGAQNSPEEAAKSVGKAVRSHLAELVKLSKEQLLEKRYARYRALGELDDGKVIDINEAAS